MDGFTSAAGTAFGILYAEDFDDPVEATQGAAMPEPEPPPLTRADLDAACEAAVHAARVNWQAGNEKAGVDAINALTAALAGLRDTTERTTLAAAEGTVTTILSMVNGLLPHFCREHGPAEVRALLARLLPTIRSQGRIAVRVHADLVTSVGRELAKMDPATAAMIDVIEAPVERGDVKVAWLNGSTVRDTKQIEQAITDALNELGLFRALETPAKRSLAYAD